MAVMHLGDVPPTGMDGRESRYTRRTACHIFMPVYDDALDMQPTAHQRPTGGDLQEVLDIHCLSLVA